MKLDLTHPWHLLLADPESVSGMINAGDLGKILADPMLAPDPAFFAAAELSAITERISGRPLSIGSGHEDEFIFVLNWGSDATKRGFAWRASPTRVEIHGESKAGLLRGVYDFLAAAGFFWVAPGIEGERLPASGKEGFLELSAAGGHFDKSCPRPVLILGHGSYLERAEDYFLWAARNGYEGVFMHTVEGAFALGACPARAYEKARPRVASLAARLGLELEEGGHLLSSFLPRKIYRSEPELFRMTKGKRKPDRNFCVSNPRSLETIASNFQRFVRSRPEVGVFHIWPDDLPGEGWCSCPSCEKLTPAAQSLRAALALSSALEIERPDAKLSFLAYHDTEAFAGDLPANLPANLELLWAPRRRCWARGYDDPADGLNSASAKAFETAMAAFSSGGTSVFEYYEDAFLFKGAVPPLFSTMAKDLRWYASRASSIGILLTGSRLPLAARPNLWLFPRLAKLGAKGDDTKADLDSLFEEWAAATYGDAAGSMVRYWKALEKGWAINLDLLPGDTENRLPNPLAQSVITPPADWGDPWMAKAQRLSERRGRCEELFDHLRAAETALAEAAALTPPGSVFSKAVDAESAEYTISGAILELDSARIACYHELASGELRAAADLSLIARSALDGLRRAVRAVPDRRSRKDLGFLGFFHYDLRLREIRRRAHPLTGIVGIAWAFCELCARALGIRRLWEVRERQ